MLYEAITLPSSDDAPLSALAFKNALSHFAQIGPDNIWAFNKRVEYHAWTGDKGGCAAGPQGSRDIPGVGRNQPEIADGYPQAICHHPVGFGGGF